VSEVVWSASGTTPDAIDEALRSMLRELHAANEALAPARVLNMVVVVDRESKGAVANRLAGVGRYHASRTVLCAVEPGRTKLDARAVMSYDEASDAPGVIHEQVEIDLGPEQLPALETIVDPVLVAELPTVLWCPHGHEPAIRAMRERIDVMLLDTDDAAAPAIAADGVADRLARSAALLESAYVVDLAWLRTTPWRERLAASFDPADRRDVLARLATIVVRHQPDSIASALLVGGWLRSRLSREFEVELEPVEQQAPGLAGITVRGERGFALSLDRGRGGLCARERSLEGEERVWQVLGASRGEGGILGEGVRQALLRDPTYGPALASARELRAS
jgi:glucose-6-phosphate dehydrogenase assembly protein OpcA